MKNYLFCYGTLKSGFKNNHLLDSGLYVGADVTTNEYYMGTMFGDFPAVSKEPKAFHISGEIYCIDDETLDKVDHLESNGYFYRRELIVTDIFDRPVWMYFLINNFEMPSIKHIEVNDGIQTWVK